MHTPVLEDRLLRPREVAAMLGVSLGTLANQRVSGTGLPFIRLGTRCVRYRVSEVERWLDERRATSTSDRRERTATP